MNVKMVSALEWEQHLLSPEKQSWEQQGQEVWKHTARNLQSDSKVHALLTKDTVLSLQEFLAKKSKKADECTQDGADGGLGGSDDMDQNLNEEEEEDDEQKLSSLVGAAADVMNITGQPLRRTASSLSLSTSKKSQSQGVFHTPDSSSKMTSKSRGSQEVSFDMAHVEQSEKQSCISSMSASKKKGSIKRGKCSPLLKWKKDQPLKCNLAP